MIFENSVVGTIEPGTPIVLVGGKAVAFSYADHAISDIVGASYPMSMTSGRALRVPDGPLFYENDSVLWSDDLQYLVDSDGNQVFNEAYTPINPYNDSAHYTLCISRGMVPVLSLYSNLPATWHLLAHKENYDWYFIQ